MKKITMFIVMSLLLMAVPAATMAQDGAVPQAISGETIPCPMPLAPGDVDGETIICGQIEVPEDWDDPDSDPITITYARKLSFSLSPLEDPIIYFMGGPGASVLAFQGSSNFDFSYLRQTRDVIVWDQRGTRYSSDLLCPQDVLQPDNEAATALGAQESQLSLQDDPQEVADYAQALTFEALGQANCPAYFEEQGVDVSEYSTDNTVLDAIALMDHLDYPVYNLFGISYGTTVTMAIMEYYQNNPDADLPPIRSALIDGVAPLEQVTLADAALTGGRNILRVFENCEADDACGAAYPDSQQTLIDLLASLESSPVTDADGNEVTLDDVLNVLTKATTERVDLVPYLPRMADELANGETATYQVVATLAASAPVQAAPPSAPSANPLDVLTARAASLADELRLLADDVGELGETSEDLAAAIEEAETLPELYLALLNSFLADTDPETRDLYGKVIRQNYVGHPEQQTKESLLGLSSQLPEPASGELQAVVNLMSEDEAAAVWAEMTDEAQFNRFILSGDITNFVVKCNTQRPSADIEEGFEEMSSFPAPQLIDGHDLLVFANLVVACDVYDAGPLEAADEEVVILDVVPTLILNGGTDHATPVEWGEVAFERFDSENTRMLTVPLTDHGVTRFSKCAKDIAHAYFLNPEMELTTDCIEAFAPDYVLPDDDLPGATAGLFDSFPAAGIALFSGANASLPYSSSLLPPYLRGPNGLVP